MRLRATLASIALLGSLGSASTANAGLMEISNMFVFGDSLSDGGNSGIVSRAATGGAFTYPPPPYYNGQILQRAGRRGVSVEPLQPV